MPLIGRKIFYSFTPITLEFPRCASLSQPARCFDDGRRAPRRGAGQRPLRRHAIATPPRAKYYAEATAMNYDFRRPPFRLGPRRPAELRLARLLLAALLDAAATL